MNLPKISLTLPSLLELDPQILQALLLVGFVFIFAVLIGFSRHYLTSSTLQGVWSGFVMGIIALIIIEGGVFFGVKHFVWGEKANLLPENLRIVLLNSGQNLTKVLGLETERQRPTAQTVVLDYSLLSPLDADLARNSICLPQQGAGQIK